jgi:hypothetical protein
MKLINIHPLTELLRMFCGRRRELQRANHIDEELTIDAYEQCAQEIGTKVLAPIVEKTHSAECDDREATRIIDDVLSDGRVDLSEVAALKRARAFAHRSAERDHDVSELAKFE